MKKQRSVSKRQSVAERHSLAELIQEGRTDLVDQVMRGELTASAALNRDRLAKRRERGRTDDDR